MAVEQIELEVVRHIAEVEHHIAEAGLHIAEAGLHTEEVGHHIEEAEHRTEEVAHHSLAAAEEQALANQILANPPLEQEQVRVPELARDHVPPAVEEDGCNFANRLGCCQRMNRPRALVQLNLGFRRDRVAEQARHVEFLRGLA